MSSVEHTQSSAIDTSSELARVKIGPQQTSPISFPCRFCGGDVRHTFLDLGMSPLCESYLSVQQLHEMEAFYPLHVFVCGNCFLVQLREYVKPEIIFSEYDYFSSYSISWVEHARQSCEMITGRLNLG